MEAEGFYIHWINYPVCTTTKDKFKIVFGDKSGFVLRKLVDDDSGRWSHYLIVVHMLYRYLDITCRYRAFVAKDDLKMCVSCGNINTNR